MGYYDEFCKTIGELDDYLILDTETTGLADGEICQIAVINNNGHVVLDTFVRTRYPIPAEATAIHRITDEMVEFAPTFPVIADVLQALLFDKVVVVYNAVYDRKMLHKSAERWEMPKIEWKNLATFHCAMEAYAEYYGQWNDYHGSYRWQKLTSAAKAENVLVENAHNAYGDCLMTLGVVTAMIKAYRLKAANLGEGKDTHE